MARSASSQKAEKPKGTGPLDARSYRTLWSHSTPKPTDFTAIAFRWPALPQQLLGRWEIWRPSLKGRQAQQPCHRSTLRRRHGLPARQQGRLASSADAVPPVRVLTFVDNHHRATVTVLQSMADGNGCRKRIGLVVASIHPRAVTVSDHYLEPLFAGNHLRRSFLPGRKRSAWHLRKRRGSWIWAAQGSHVSDEETRSRQQAVIAQSRCGFCAERFGASCLLERVNIDHLPVIFL